MSGTDQDTEPHRRSSSLSPSTSPSTSRRRRPQLPRLNFLDVEDIDDRLPSPPYTRNPDHPYINLDVLTEESPAYIPRAQLDNSTEVTPMVQDTDEKRDPFEGDIENEDSNKPRAKTARFRDDIISPAAEHLRFVTTDTDDSDSRSVSPSIADTEDDDDYYDWSGEDDLVEEEAKYEQSMGTKKKEKWGFRKYLAIIFGSLLGSAILSGIIITPAILVHFLWYKPRPDEHRTYVKDNLEAWLFWAAANLTISWYLALIIDVVPIFVRYLISAFWGHVSEGVKTKTELYNSVKDTIKPLFYAASMWASWVIIFENIYHLYDLDDKTKSRAQYTNRMYQVVELIFFLAVVLCGEQMLQHAVAFSFHRTAYRERLEKLQEALRAIEHLRIYRPKKSHIKSSSAGFGSRSFNALNLSSAFGYGSRPGTPTRGRTDSRPPTPYGSRPASPNGRHTDEMGVQIRDEPNTETESPTAFRRRSKGKSKAHGISGWFSHDTSPQTESDSPTTPERRAEASSHHYPPSVAPSRKRRSRSQSIEPRSGGGVFVTAWRTLKTALLHDARNLEGRDDVDMSGLVWSVSSSYEAKRLARAIYAAFRSPTRTYLIPGDFTPAFATQEEAAAAFRVFDVDNNGDLSRGEIKSTLIKFYRERRSLSRSMRDVSQALQSLNQIMLFFAMVILLFISLSVFEVNVGSSLTSLYSLGIGLSFIFKNAASNAFDAVMFLFVSHPFDTGDRCFIDDENLVVKKMGLFATVFQRVDGTESYYFNSQLFNKFIINARRSDKTAEGLTLHLHWRTPWKKLDQLADCLNAWLATEHNRWFQPTTSITPQNIQYMRHMEITIGIGHNSNWQDWNLRLARRTTFNAAVNYYCRELGIGTHESTIPIVYADRDTQDILYGDGEDEYYDADYESDVRSQEQREEPKDAYRPTCLGFQPPSDKPMAGVRARKSRNKKAMLRTMGADG